MANILIIDDDVKIRTLIASYAKEDNHYAAVAESLTDGFEIAGFQLFDLIFLDVRLPDGNGLDALPKFKQMPPEPEVVIITGVSDAEGAELAIKSGAWDFLQKPFSKSEIKLQIRRSLEFREKKTSTGCISLIRDQIIGNSPQMKFVLNQVSQCVGSNVNVLVTGDTGTGKELFAHTIHNNSSPAEAPFIVVDCAALPDTLIESILFGHVKGSFTGAEKDQIGLVKQADGGTLFLDEVGELSLSIQRSFLRILQEKRFRPVGSSQEIKSDFRLISATNRHINAMVKEGKFRQDLLFRLRTFQIDLPPLRNRLKDIEELTLYYIFKLCKRHGLHTKGFVPEFLDLLQQYHWPGNVRELINTIEKAIVSDPENPTLYPIHLPAAIRIHHTRTAAAIKRESEKNDDQPIPENKGPTLAFSDLLNADLPLKTFKQKIIKACEKQYLKHLMNATHYNAKKASRISGLSLSRFYTLLREYDIPVKQA